MVLILGGGAQVNLVLVLGGAQVRGEIPLSQGSV